MGKSFLARDFAARLGLELKEINFEKAPALARLFEEADTKGIHRLLEAHFKASLNERTLLFLDEIQSAPSVLSRLRYFYEDLPQIPVIAAGSLLDFTLSEMEQPVPVGRVEYLFIGPMSFEEYLLARGESRLLEIMHEWTPQGPAIPHAVHDKLNEHVLQFSLIGGMPEAVREFAQTGDYLACETIHRSILNSYREDFSKYRKRIPLERLQLLFSQIPAQIGKKWVHSRVDPDSRAAATLAALKALSMSRVATIVHHSSGNGVPLAAERKDNLYKALFLDIGLMSGILGINPAQWMTSKDPEEKLMRVNEGAIAEQWVGQHLLDLRAWDQTPELYYWTREKAGSMAEVDYLIQHGSRVIPIEVKAGASGKLKSLQVFMDEKNSKIGIHLGMHLPQVEGRLLKLPIYMTGQISRILSFQCM